MNGRIPPLLDVGSTTATRRTRRPKPEPVPELSPAELARDAMTTAAAELRVRPQHSAGAVHYQIGVFRLDFTMGLVGSGELLVRDLRALEAIVRAGLAALETQP